MNEEMKTIGFYIPRWLYKSDPSDAFFADEFLKAINESGRCTAISLNLPKLKLSSREDVQVFCEQNNVRLIVQHDSTFFTEDVQYKKNVAFLETCVPFLNSQKSHEIGHDKIATKRLLKEKGIPVLEDKIIKSIAELQTALEEGKWYVAKPPNRGAGAGVKLIKREGRKIFEYWNGSWRKIPVKEVEKGVRLGTFFNREFLLLITISIIAILPGSLFATFSFAGILIVLPMLYSFLQSDRGFTYETILLEPYFNDGEKSFSSLRCTIIGNEIVEMVKRTNHKNITSNVSRGGTATRFQFTEEQKQIALSAKNAIGAEYAGVDLLVCNGKSVVGEVNIGPFTVYSETTGVNVGKLLAEYVLSHLWTRRT